jgi:hypothetical protein
MSVHRSCRLFFIGAKGNAIPISEHKPLVKANFLDDVLGHCRASGSELLLVYAVSIAGLLIRPDQPQREATS